MKAPKAHYSIAVMGPGAVGKSALIMQYTKGVFVRDYDPTIEDAFRKTATVDEEMYYLDLLDTAGQEEYLALRATWMRERDGFVLVFSLCDHKSLKELGIFLTQIENIYEGQSPSVIIVGNKADLVEQRAVTVEQAEELAKTHGCKYLETSAKTGHNIESAFVELVRQITKAREKAPEPAPEEAPKKRRRFCAIL